MSSGLPVIAYVGALLPKRSETFVYREVLGLRARGHEVVPVSLRRAGDGEVDDDPVLAALRDEAVVVYGPGWAGRALRELVVHPWAAGRAKWRLFGAACRSRDLGLRGWLKLPAQYLGGLALAGALRERGVQHLHAHMAHAPTTVAMVAADALGVRFSFTGHAADLFRDRSLLRGKLRRAAFVACISEWHRGWYRGVEPGLDEAKLPVVRCGVDVDEFSPRAPVDAVFGLDGGRHPVVLGVGRLVPKKGFDGLLRAWAGWLSDNGWPNREGEPADGSTGVDGGPMCVIMSDGPEEGPLRALAEDLGIGAHVQFTGAANQEQVRSAMAGCDVFALPCVEASDGDRDGIPVVLMEAMASGKAVIAGDLPAIRELVGVCGAGKLVKAGNVSMLKAALADFLGSPEQRERAGVAGRARVVDEFASGVNLGRLERAFSRVVGD